MSWSFAADPRVLAGALLMTCLTGCASYQARPLVPADTAAAFESRTLHDAGLQQLLSAALPAMTAQSPRYDLRKLTAVAYYYHPDLDLARARWQVAQAAAITAGARPNPGLNLSAEFNADAPDDTSRWARGVSLSIPIETAGKRGHRIEQARHLAEVARLNLLDTAWLVRSRVRQSLLNTYPSEQLTAAQQSLESERVRLMERRLQLGFAAAPDLTEARIALQQATLARQEAHRRLAENRVRLASALGLPISALDGVELSFDGFEHLPDVSALPALDVQRQALLRRPDVRAALADYQASQSALQIEVAKQYPDITLGPGFLMDAGQAKWSLGLSLVLPLLNRNQGPIAEAEARRQLAAANFLTVQTRAIGEVEQALAGYRAVLDKLRTADTLLATQRRKEQSAARLQRAGETDRSTLLGAQVELAVAELARVETLLQAQQALGALEDAVRRPLDGELLPAITIEHNPRDQDMK